MLLFSDTATDSISLIKSLLSLKSYCSNISFDNTHTPVKALLAQLLSAEGSLITAVTLLAQSIQCLSLNISIQCSYRYIIEYFGDKVNGFSIKLLFPIDKSAFCVSAESCGNKMDFSLNWQSHSLRVN